MSLLKLFSFILRLFRREERFHTIYPKCYEDIVEILRQARDNGSCLKVTAGSFPASATSDEILVDIRYINRLVGLDAIQKRVTVEGGMHLSTLIRILESVHLTLDIQGRIPDVTVCDAINAGVFGGSSTLMSIIYSTEVCLSNGRIVTWTWERDPSHMKAMCCGLGMIGVLVSVTFKCIPLIRYTEISYLCSIRDVLESWTTECKSSLYQQIYWFPFSELVVLTHVNSADKMQTAKQPFTNKIFERLSLSCSYFLRILSQATIPNLPFITAIIGRMQFFSQWSVANHRSDYSHSPINFWSSKEACRGTEWMLPLDSLPDILNEIFQWTQNNPECCVSPIFIQTSPEDRSLINTPRPPPTIPYLLPVTPNTNKRLCSVWYDWFVPEGYPNPILVHNFEEIFLSAGGVRGWSGERIVSPLVLADHFPYYKKWCRVKSEVDPELVFNSAYVQGTIFSKTAVTSRNRGNWSECSSLCGSVSSLIM